jgi:hypothetical protein
VDPRNRSQWRVALTGGEPITAAMPSLSITFKASASAALSVVDLAYQAMYRFTSADTQTRITATRGRDHRQSREPMEQLGQTHFHQDCIVASATRCGPTLPNKALRSGSRQKCSHPRASGIRAASLAGAPARRKIVAARQATRICSVRSPAG